MSDEYRQMYSNPGSAAEVPMYVDGERVLTTAEAVAQERERCATIADRVALTETYSWQRVAQLIAAEIRAGKQS